MQPLRPGSHRLGHAHREGVHTVVLGLWHHYTSVLLAAGESAIVVAEQLDHDDAGMILRVYGHVMPHAEDCTRRASTRRDRRPLP